MTMYLLHRDRVYRREDWRLVVLLHGRPQHVRGGAESSNDAHDPIEKLGDVTRFRDVSMKI